MSEPKWIPLKAWAKRVYGDFMPCNHTLLKWAHDGLIQPQPKKHGRFWKVCPNAEYKDD